MACRRIPAEKARTKLGFNQNDVILKKEQSMLTKIMSSYNNALINNALKWMMLCVEHTNMHKVELKP